MIVYDPKDSEESNCILLRRRRMQDAEDKTSEGMVSSAMPKRYTITPTCCEKLLMQCETSLAVSCSPAAVARIMAYGDFLLLLRS